MRMMKEHIRLKALFFAVIAAVMCWSLSSRAWAQSSGNPNGADTSVVNGSTTINDTNPSQPSDIVQSYDARFPFMKDIRLLAYKSRR